MIFIIDSFRPIPPLDNCHLGQLPPRKFPRRTMSPRQFITGKIVPWTILKANSHLGLLHCPRTITALSNDNYKLHFFQGYFLFLFHGPIIQLLFSVMTTIIIIIIIIILIIIEIKHVV